MEPGSRGALAELTSNMKGLSLATKQEVKASVPEGGAVDESESSSHVERHANPPTLTLVSADALKETLTQEEREKFNKLVQRAKAKEEECLYHKANELFQRAYDVFPSQKVGSPLHTPTRNAALSLNPRSILSS